MLSPRRTAAAIVTVLLLGCSSSKDEAPPAPPEVLLPDVQGVPALEDENSDPNVVEVTLVAQPVNVEIDGKQVAMRGYNGLVPGPMLKAKVGDEVIVHFTNSLSEATTIHWHGLRISDQMDGSPRIQAPVPPGGEFTYRFKVPEAGTFWYHPHMHGNVQIESGLYAPIVFIDPAKEPAYDAQRFLVLDDILIDGTGKKIMAPFSGGMPDMMVGRYGDTMLTNGRSAKEAHASAEQGTIERWRLVNTANARTMLLELEGASFRIIGTDGGLLPAPYTTKRLELAVGQRYDVEVTYDKAGKVSLINYDQIFDQNDQMVEVPTTMFAVDVTPSARVPKVIEWPMIELPSRPADASATITINAVQGGDMGVEWQLNGKSNAEEPLLTYPQGTAVKIRLKNSLGPEHPFHLHGQFFEIVSRKEPGLKDVVLVPGGVDSYVDIVAYMDNPGR